MSFDQEIAKLASHVAKKASETDTPLQESTDALKVLTAYYGLIRKRGLGEDEPAEEPSLASMVRSMEESANGGVEARGHRRRRPTAQ